MKVELEAANIEGAFNRALRDVGSQTQAHQTISGAHWICFEASNIKDYDHSQNPTAAQGSIDCAHWQARTEPAVEIYVFGRMS